MNSCISGGLPCESYLADLLLLHGGGVFPVGYGLDAVVVPEPLAHAALDTIGWHPADPVGAVAALADGWVFFVPEESDGPSWSDRVRYLSGGSSIGIPPPPGPPEAHDPAQWIRWPCCGRVFAPLLIQFPPHALGRRILPS
ncbi:hypothetical protein ACFV19_06865 [Streptomyces griseoluteus]|uniref:hypothetical protein n=1 Tax=Streptomyces griseoluteus TaxID=29306 RepID=UPI0036C028D8